MKRKIVRHGPISLTVSLPSKWVKRYGLKAGDEIEVMEEGDYLKLLSGKDLTLGEFKQKIRKTTLSYLKSIISNAYKKGYDKINLEYDDESVLRDIQKVVDTLLGVEIIFKSRGHCEIRNIARELESEFDSLFKNSFILLMEMGHQVYNDVKFKQFNHADYVSYTKETITKYTDFCKRILNKHKKNEINVIFLYLIVWNLEKIANEYKYISNYCAKSSPHNFSKPMFDFFIKTNDLLSLYYQAYYEKSSQKINQLAVIKDKLLFEDYYNLRTKFTSDDQPIIHHLGNIVRRLWDMSGPFFGLNG